MATKLIVPKANWREIASPVPYCRAFMWGDLKVFVGREPVGPQGALQWHLRISHPYRYPTWEEIKAARYDHIPDEATMAMLLPPKSQWVNIHNNCFHLHEIEGE